MHLLLLKLTSMIELIKSADDYNESKYEYISFIVHVIHFILLRLGEPVKSSILFAICFRCLHFCAIHRI